MNSEQPNEEEKKEETVLKPFSIIIPDCCKEGWDSCTHVVGKQEKKKKNIGL